LAKYEKEDDDWHLICCLVKIKNYKSTGEELIFVTPFFIWCFIFFLIYVLFEGAEPGDQRTRCIKGVQDVELRDWHLHRVILPIAVLVVADKEAKEAPFALQHIHL
jgi:hypothetical protein